MDRKKSFQGRVRRACKRSSRHLRRRVVPAQQQLLFILGCQRSGTSLVEQTFERDWNALAFGEYSELSSDDSEFGLRLNPLDFVERRMRREPFPLVVAKSLVESQRALELLDQVSDSKILWVYRSYVDVAASNLVKFGEQVGIRNIRWIALRDTDNWRSENVSPTVLETVTRHFSDDMNPIDAACLFWYSRNMHFLESKLGAQIDSGRVFLLPYERLISDTDATMRAVYRFLQRPYPGPRLVSAIDTASVGKGQRRAAECSGAVRRTCDEVLTELDRIAGYERV